MHICRRMEELACTRKANKALEINLMMVVQELIGIIDNACKLLNEV